MHSQKDNTSRSDAATVNFPYAYSVDCDISLGAVTDQLVDLVHQNKTTGPRSNR